MDDKSFLDQILECKETFILGLNATQFFVLISHLQVAQRYVDGDSRAIAQELIDSFIGTLSKEIPTARAVLELGNNPAFDVDADYFDQEF
ncbi:hypothetical protein AWQ21_14545 (plasmid) [Picosynechococcus sp. PCC 7003]|uniref:hypothetical protein n=1 Tax=Picosynechococcus sp. PCC 7003 TaxID=374981 RepID=UPI0008103CB4|nr:hypothetical protein [Picosynechococcus sp. PCC 7003]ANV85750.1 hypothetical protein AWQ21_14545 [Picosynechococcus sp. PCC 7003]